MKKLITSVGLVLATSTSLHALAQSPTTATTPVVAPKPYDETANANEDIAKALVDAKANNKHVLIVFGANWCPDCVELDRAFKKNSAEMLKARFEIVKVDVGRFDKNKELAASYGNPIKKGIPAAVIVKPDNSIVYASAGGELSNARRMGEQGINDFFSDLIKQKLGK